MPLITNLDELKGFFGLVPIMIADLPIDILHSETPVYDYEVTEHPAEAGSDLTDNRRAKPVGVTLDVTLTDTSLSPSAVGTALISGTFGLESWRDKKDRLYDIMRNDEVVNVTTDLDSYESQVIQSLTPSRTPQNSNSFRCTIVLKQVRIVSSSVSILDPSNVPKSLKEKESASQKETGKKKNKPKTPKGKKDLKTPGGKQQSVLLKLKNQAAGLLGS